MAHRTAVARLLNCLLIVAMLVGLVPSVALTAALDGRAVNLNAIETNVSMPADAGNDRGSAPTAGEDRTPKQEVRPADGGKDQGKRQGKHRDKNQGTDKGKNQSKSLLQNLHALHSGVGGDDPTWSRWAIALAVSSPRV